MSGASELAHRLKAKRAGTGWTARCPAHDDRTASLSINEGQDGKLYCHAGCPFEAILKAVDIGPAKPNGHDSGNHTGKTEAQLVATYNYEDATGKLVFQVVRYAPKDFRQRRPDGNGEWIWSMHGVERVPYRLPQLLNATEVYICEGEKDCDNLVKLGLSATTNPGGADGDGEGGRKWPDSFGRWFHGRHAILIPDNDEPGRRHVQAVATKLNGRAASIRILELPDLPTKGDVSDWLAAGGTREQLEDMAAAAPLWEPDAAPPPPDVETKGADHSAQPAWGEPIDIIGAPELVGWPELSTDCLPLSLYSYAMAEAERLSVDPCALAAHICAAVATVCSDVWRVKPKQHDLWTQQPRIWSCVIKDVGQRGTDMLRSAFWPISRIEEEMRKEWEQKMAEWEERQANRKHGDKTKDLPPVCQRLTTQDATVEAAGKILSKGNEYSKLTYKADELVTFLAGAGRYSDKGAAARALWLESFDGGPQHIDRITRGFVHIPNWSMVVAGNIQPRRLAGMAKDLVDDGLFQRFLTIHTRPSAIGIEDDIPLDPSAGSYYSDVLRTIKTLMPAKDAEGGYAPRTSTTKRVQSVPISRR